MPGGGEELMGWQILRPQASWREIYIYIKNKYDRICECRQSWCKNSVDVRITDIGRELYAESIIYAGSWCTQYWWYTQSWCRPTYSRYTQGDDVRRTDTGGVHVGLRRVDIRKELMYAELIYALDEGLRRVNIRRELLYADLINAELMYAENRCRFHIYT